MLKLRSIKIDFDFFFLNNSSQNADISLFHFFLLENLTITRSFRLILGRGSRSPGETAVLVTSKAWHVFSWSCLSSISSGAGFTSIFSFHRYWISFFLIFLSVWRKAWCSFLIQVQNAHRHIFQQFIKS